MKITTAQGAIIEVRDHGTTVTVTSDNEIRINGPVEYQQVGGKLSIVLPDGAGEELMQQFKQQAKPGALVANEEKKSSRLRPGLPVYVYNLKHANLTTRREADAFYAVIVFVGHPDSEKVNYRVCTVAGYDHVGTPFRESMVVLDLVPGSNALMEARNRPEPYAVVAASL